MKRILAKGKKLFRGASNRRYLRGLRYGVAPAIEHEGTLRLLSCTTVVDVGANRGQFALVARHTFPAARIIAFEPLPGPGDEFARVFKDDREVQLHRVAIGTHAQRAEMHIAARDDSSSMLPIGAEQSRVFPGTEEVGTTVIDVRRLADECSRDDIVSPALLKLDVQGFELEALRGCESLLSLFSWVYCECSFLSLYEGQALADEVIAWLHDRQFRLVGVYNMSYDRQGKAVQADFLFAYGAESGN